MEFLSVFLSVSATHGKQYIRLMYTVQVYCLTPVLLVGRSAYGMIDWLEYTWSTC